MTTDAGNLTPHFVLGHLSIMNKKNLTPMGQWRGLGVGLPTSAVTSEQGT